MSIPKSTKFASATDSAAATRYYPSANGWDMHHWSAAAIQASITGGVTWTVEATLSPLGDPDAVWDDISALFVDQDTGTSGAVSWIDDTDINIMAVGLDYERLRIKEVTSDATNVVLGWIRLSDVESLSGGAGAIPAGAATAALQTSLTGTIRHTTTPSKEDAATGPAEVDKRGSAHVNAALRHVRRVPLTSGLATSAASLTEGACDCIRVTAGDVVAYLQGPETALLASQNGADWTGGAGWSRVGNVWSHAAGGGASDLEYTMAGLNVGDTACVIYTLVWTAGTSVTEKLGTGAGSARSSSATFVKLITSAGSAKIIFSATDDAVCDIDVSTVYVIPGSPPLVANTWEPQSAVKVVALAAKATPATADTTTQVYAGWYRRPTATEVT